jgi:hypothetical protein
MLKKAEPDSKGPTEFIFFAWELLPDELFLVSIVVSVVFGFIWLLGAAFRTFFD